MIPVRLRIYSPVATVVLVGFLVFDKIRIAPNLVLSLSLSLISFGDISVPRTFSLGVLCMTEIPV